MQSAQTPKINRQPVKTKHTEANTVSDGITHRRRSKLLWSYISFIFSIVFYVNWSKLYPSFKKDSWPKSANWKRQFQEATHVKKWFHAVGKQAQWTKLMSKFQWLRGYGRMHSAGRRNGSIKRKPSNRRRHYHKVQHHSSDVRHQEVLKKYRVRWLLYRQMPLKAMSRLWGRLNKINLPMFLRNPAYQLYIYLFNCCMEEVAVQDLKTYNNLSEFFRRNLRTNIRPIANTLITSPADGRVLHLGKVQDCVIEQVKGITYSLSEFLGPLNFLPNNETSKEAVKKNDESVNNAAESAPENVDVLLQSCDLNSSALPQSNILNVSSNDNSNVSQCDNAKVMQCDNVKVPLCDNSNDLDIKKLLHHSGNSLYYLVVYLGPGDYHHFHSPTEWTVNFRRHFSGYLFSVNPRIANWLQGLFSLNERVLYCGHWQHGFFSFTAVGATNVGSINIYFDEELETNASNNKFREHKDKIFDSTTGNGPVKCHKGRMMGDFNFGSSIVLLFEGPEDMEFCVTQGQRIKFGQALTTF